MADLSTLETPAAIVDVDRLHANLRRAAEYTRAHGLAWRPHAKTHKSSALAAKQVGAGAVGVTVATPREAEVMSRSVDDLLVAYPPVGAWRLARLMALPAHVRLTVALDSADALRALAAAARDAGRTVGVLLEVDVGMHRVGTATSAEVVALAREAASLASIEYRGMLYYPGHVRMPAAEQDQAIAALSATVGGLVAALADAGLPPSVVSGGSTPTFWRSHEVAGTTEVRPGTNVFNDRTTAHIGACAWNDVAYSVLATVVSTSVPGQAVIDAGSKALGREELPGGGGGLGALLDRPEVRVARTSEEHGIIDLANTDWRPRVGDRVRVVPNHVCLSVDLSETLWGVLGDQVVSEWPVEGHGRSRFGG